MDVRHVASEIAFGWRNRHEITVLASGQVITIVPDTSMEILLPMECDITGHGHLEETSKDGVRIGTQDQERICPGSLILNTNFRIGDSDETAGWLTLDSNSITGVYVNLGTHTARPQ